MSDHRFKITVVFLDWILNKQTGNIMKKNNAFTAKFLPIGLLLMGIVLILRAFIMEPTIIDLTTKGFTPKEVDHLIGFIIGLGGIYYSFKIRKKYKNKT